MLPSSALTCDPLPAPATIIPMCSHQGFQIAMDPNSDRAPGVAPRESSAVYKREGSSAGVERCLSGGCAVVCNGPFPGEHLKLRGFVVPVVPDGRLYSRHSQG